MKHTTTTLYIFALSATLVACGGGGGGDTSSATPTTGNSTTNLTTAQTTGPGPTPTPTSVPESTTSENQSPMIPPDISGSPLANSLSQPIQPIASLREELINENGSLENNPVNSGTTTPGASVTTTTTTSVNGVTDTVTDQTTVTQPDPEPVSTPRPVGASIEIDGMVYRSEDYSGDLRLYVQVINRGQSMGTFARVSCAIRSADSALLDTVDSYVFGDNIRLNSINSNTGTALKPDSIGFAEIRTDVPIAQAATVDCSTNWNVARNVSDPQAVLELTGNITRRKDFSDDIRYLGSVQNTGSKGLVFGDVTLITKGANGAIIDISRTYIDGDTVYLSSIDNTTGTGLHAGNNGTFEMYTDAPFNQYGEHIVRTSWEDWANGSTRTNHARYKESRPTIEELQQAYIEAEGL